MLEDTNSLDAAQMILVFPHVQSFDWFLLMVVGRWREQVWTAFISLQVNCLYTKINGDEIAVNTHRRINPI